MKSGGSGGLFERNLVACTRDVDSGGVRIGLSFGGGGTAPQFCAPAFDPAVPCDVEHTNGVMRNNLLLACSDVGIYVNRGANTKLVHNTLVATSGIDFRFPTTTGEAHGNLLMGKIRARDGSTFADTSNVANQPLDFFTALYADPLALDFRVVGDPSALALGPARADVLDDYCARQRPPASLALGALEHSAGDCDVSPPPAPPGEGGATGSGGGATTTTTSSGGGGGGGGGSGSGVDAADGSGCACELRGNHRGCSMPSLTLALGMVVLVGLRFRRRRPQSPTHGNGTSRGESRHVARGRSGRRLLAFVPLWLGCTGGETKPDEGALAPRIQDVLECGTPASAGGLSGVGPDPDDPLQAHFFDPAVFPDALCNDGTPATVYFRPGSDPTQRNRWVIQLMGGGGCRSGDSCAARWCSHMTNFGVTQMTSSVAPTRGTDGEGVLQEERPDNLWAGYNHVLLRYCSSDNWSGTRHDVTLEGHHPLTGEEIAFRVDFLGSRIIDATLATLRRDGVPALRWDYGGGIDMPDLDDATEVILAGASAGGGGVVRSLDRVAATLAETHCAGCEPLVVRGLVDSSYGASSKALDWSTTVQCTGLGLCSYEAQMQEEFTTGGHGTWGARMDQSCLDWHAKNAPGTEYLCADVGHVLENHVTSAFFVRQGLPDVLLSGNMVEAKFTVPGEGLMTVSSFARL
ncbi:MAG: hypothetical protein FJ104_13320, partial [Deltaproteobacteria bacterium]|nr:hypothetical protein [Deltaproteobacteria bacterium]